MAVSVVDAEKRDLIDRIMDRLKKGYSVSLEAPPGYGKTFIASYVATELAPSIVITRTHAEISEVVSMAGKKIAYAYGRPSICKKMPRDSFSYSICRAFASSGICRETVSRREIAYIAARVRSEKEIRDYRDACLYRAMKVYAEKARRASVTYDYVIANPSIVEGRRVVIMDEVQKIIEILVQSVEFTSPERVSELSKLARDENDRRLLYAFKAAMKRSASTRDLISYFDKMSSWTGDSPLASEIMGIVDACLAGRCLYTGGILYYLPINISINTLLSRKPLLAMGIMIPDIVSSRCDETIRLGGRVIEAYIDDSINMRYSEREKIDINYLANLATKYIDKDGGNLVVTVNKRYADEISKILTSKGYKMLSKEDIIAKRYMAPGSIAVDVAGGSLTEGINILGLTRVIVLGALYPSPSPELDIAGKVVGSIYEKIAILRTAQAVGRIRGRGSAVLIDQRFKELRNTMPKWIDIIN